MITLPYNAKGGRLTITQSAKQGGSFITTLLCFYTIRKGVFVAKTGEKQDK
jgi:hypothetical protein